MRRGRYILCIILVCICSGRLQAQTKFISGKYYAQVDVFVDNAEQEQLSKREYSQSDFFDLYWGRGDSKLKSEAKQKIISFVDNVKAEGVGVKVKDLKRLYKKVHEVFFKKYVDNPLFHDIFSKGEYNCATATALYALILDEVSIPYQIRETPTHVYLIAEPNGANLVFESTAPGMKTLQISEKFKESFIGYLVENKIVTDTEATNRNLVFDKYYYGDEKIDKKKLVGVLYYNIGVAALLNEDYNLAYKNFEKAYLLNPAKKNEYLITYALLLDIIKNEKGNEDRNLFKYLRYLELNSSEYGKNLFYSYWKMYLQKNLFDNPQLEKVQRYYNQMVSFLAHDSLSTKELQQAYYYDVAGHMGLTEKIDSSLVYFDSAYSLSPNNVVIQNLIAETVKEYARPVSASPDTIVIDRIGHLLEKYPFLNNKEKIGYVYMYHLGSTISYYYNKGNSKLGDKYYRLLVKKMDSDKGFTKNQEELCVVAFSSIYQYLVRTRQNKQAKLFLESVIKYYPENSDLKKLMGKIDDILKYG